MAFLKGTALYNSGPYFFAEGVALIKGTTVYNNDPFFFAEGVALIKGTTVYNNDPFSLLKAWPYQRVLLYIIVTPF